MCSHLIVILLVVVLVECQQNPKVSIDQGTVEGGIEKAYNEKTFYSFLGIPYAKPPLNELRFKAPVSPEPWKGVRNARKEGNSCFASQNIPTSKPLSLSEDCLYINVYTRQLPSSATAGVLKPVMVWIYGGSFTSGSGSPSMYGPQLLMSKDIVLVTFNYRAGVFGFLSLEDSSLGVPGNAGLKDQRMALQWVQKNIAKFGGNPKKVTIFGESAGSVSVHYQVLSSSTKSLFHQAIMESGSAINPWSLGPKNAIELAKFLGATVKTEAEALKALKKATATDILNAQKKISSTISEYDNSVKQPFAPVIEKPNDSAFITKDPKQLLASGDYNRVPVIMGFNNREGLYAYNDPVATKASFLENCIPWQFGIKKGSERSKQVVDGMKKLYLSSGTEGMYDVLTDTIFVYGITEAAKSHSKFPGSPVYLYEVTVDTKLGFVKPLLGAKLPGVCHGDEVGYLFKMATSPQFVANSKEGRTVEAFLTLWTNFATYGNPTPTNALGVTWKPVSDPKTITFLSIGDELKLSVNPFKDRMAFWQKVAQGKNN